ncbi:MAG: 4'-phosphopantetheinyl transferase family protein [Janthinobacterium lividum]
MKQLHVQTINVSWTKPDQNTYLDSNTIRIWRTKISAFIPNLVHLQALLEAEEIKKIQRYQQEKDRQARIISRAVLRILLGRYLSVDPVEIRFTLDHNKKLVLQHLASENLCFNVSHSGGWILIAISKNPVGVDVEQINTSFNYQNLLDFSFSSIEKNCIQTAAIPINSFYKLWTRKEALLKATGKGLVDDLTQIPSLDGIHQSPYRVIGSKTNWQITSFEIDENHIGSAAFMPVKTAVQFVNFEL